MGLGSSGPKGVEQSTSRMIRIVPTHITFVRALLYSLNVSLDEGIALGLSWGAEYQLAPPICHKLFKLISRKIGTIVT